MRAAKLSVYILSPLILLSAIAGGMLYVRLKHGPVTLDSVVPPIERGINSELIDHKVDIGGAEIRLGRAGGIEFRLRDVSVAKMDGTSLAKAPLASVAISFEALWSGRIVPARVDLIDPEINLVYTDDAGLLLRGSTEAALPAGASAPLSPPREQGGATETAIAKSPGERPEKLNLVRMLSAASGRARRRQGATSYLTEFGVSNAVVNLDYDGQRSSWRVPGASIDLNHRRRRSVISGQARISSVAGPWAMSFITDENEHTKQLELKVTVRGLVPATLGAAAPPFALMRMLDAPIGGDATLALTSDGDISRTDLALEIGPGRLSHPDLKRSLGISGGLFKLGFDGPTRRWKLEPSPIKWAGGSTVLAGEMQDAARSGEPPTWRMALNGSQTVMTATEFATPPLPIADWTMAAVVVPRRGRVEVSDFRMSGGGGVAELKGVTQSSGKGQNTFAEIKLSPMPLATLKTMWPALLAPGARDWVGHNVQAAEFKGGTIRLLTGDFVPEGTMVSNNIALNATLTFGGSRFTPVPKMAPVEAASGSVQIVNNALDMKVDDAAVVLADGRRVPIETGRLVSDNLILDRPAGEITFSTTADLGPFLAAVEQVPVPLVQKSRPFPEAGEGRVAADMTIKLPLDDHVAPHEISIIGAAKITDGRFGKVAGFYDVQGFSLDLDLTEQALGAKGRLIVNGVPAQISGQRIFDTAIVQPPVKLTAKLDAQDRKQLGLEINDFVSGDMPVEISIESPNTPQQAIAVKADLSNAELIIDGISWRKPAGRAAVFETRVDKDPSGQTTLKDFTISGDDIALKGVVDLDENRSITSFDFKSVSLNVVSRFSLSGQSKTAGIWSVKARGKTFNGLDLFRSLFQIGDRGDKGATAGRDVDLDVKLDTVLGASDTSVKNVKVLMSKRNGALSALDVRGTLDSGAPVAAALDQTTGPRRLRVESRNAGELMKLVDFYPNMQGGQLKLEVNLDGKGAADKTGVLWVDDFKVLGDAVVSEVVSSVDQGRPSISSGRRVTREVFDFDRLRAPFSIGYGQFVLDNAQVKGPLAGGNLRGKVDFTTRRVNLGGTYIPLQGLNSAIGGIPVLGQLLAGTQGEGIFGITFAVQGAMAEPQVIVNPLSLVAPGIFREIFQMTTANPSVQARDGKGVIAPQRSPTTTTDGWSSNAGTLQQR